MKLVHGHNDYFNLDLLKEILSDGNAVRETAECFAVFADEVRVRIFMLLCHMVNEVFRLCHKGAVIINLFTVGKADDIITRTAGQKGHTDQNDWPPPQEHTADHRGRSDP